MTTYNNIWQNICYCCLYRQILNKFNTSVLSGMSPYLTPGLIVHKELAWALSASCSPVQWWLFGEMILNTFRYKIFFWILWPDLSLHLYTSPHHPAGATQSKASMLLPTLLWIWIYFERILDLKILIFQRQQYMEQRYMKQPNHLGRRLISKFSPELRDSKSLGLVMENIDPPVKWPKL